MFATMLSYKLAARGGKLVYVDPAYTSQTCAECHLTDKASRIDQARFVCAHCGHQDSADVNGARNIHQARALAGEPPKRILSGSARGSTQRSDMSPKLGSPGLSGWGVCHGSSLDAATLGGRSADSQSPLRARERACPNVTMST